MHSKAERIREFLRRLLLLPPPSSREERLRDVERTLNEVENEMSGVPYNIEAHEDDGRMYPPQPDSMRDTDDPRVKRLRTRGHNIFISDDGAIEIQHAQTKEVIFTHAGKNGRGVRS